MEPIVKIICIEHKMKKKGTIFVQAFYEEKHMWNTWKMMAVKMKLKHKAGFLQVHWAMQ